MRRFRNPRYAPEALERKLSPSGVGGLPVAAVVHIPSPQSHPAPATLSNPTTVVASSHATVGSTPATAPAASPVRNPVVASTPAEMSPRFSVALADPTPSGPSTPSSPSGGTGCPPPPSDGSPPEITPAHPGSPGLPIGTD